MARRGIANSDAERIIESLTPEMLINDSLKSKKTFPWDTPLEFFESDKYCNMHLYPRQRLMLKLWNLQDDFTDYENQTIDKWCKGFKNDKYKCGIQPDIRERIAYLKANDYTHFTTIVIVAGRRFSKSRMSGAENCLADAEMLWRGIPTVSFNQDLAEEQDQIVGKDFFQKDPFNDQQDNSGIEQDSSVYSVVVATTAQQAQETLFSDYYSAVMSCKWLQQYILRITPFQIVYQTVNDKLKTLQYLSDGIPLEKELASMISRPISSNSNSIRGRSICLDPNTLVSMQDGSKRKIIDLNLGDELKAFKEDDVCARCNTEIVGKKIRKAPVRKIWFDDGTYVIATSNHKFVDENGLWREAGDLKVGESIQTEMDM